MSPLVLINLSPTLKVPVTVKNHCHHFYEKPLPHSLASLGLHSLTSLHAICFTEQNWALSPNFTMHSLTWSILWNFAHFMECVSVSVYVGSVIRWSQIAVRSVSQDSPSHAHSLFSSPLSWAIHKILLFPTKFSFFLHSVPWRVVGWVSAFIFSSNNVFFQ